MKAMSSVILAVIQMSGADITAYASALAALAAMLAVVVSALNLWVSSRNGGKADTVVASAVRTEKITDDMATTLGAVAVHVNSASDIARAKIDLLERENATLRTNISEKRQDAALLAQALATTAATHALPPAPEVRIIDPSEPTPAPTAPIEVKVVNQPDDPVPTTKGKSL